MGQVKMSNKMLMIITTGKHLIGYYRIRNISHVCRKQRLLKQRQKSYVDPRQKDVEFAVGDYVFLKVSSMKGVMRFRKEGKLPTRYIGPFEVIDRVGTVANQLELSPSLSHVHPVFHISMLRKYVPDPSHVLQPDVVELNENLTFKE
ncbi:uncharacterized protein LOC110672159 [Hevea brasiliensis]|uniref:uncharacterized protein LOC110672159 n=1 Tax=Hevea brasiliensis TaxID=3981 RepID=UPI000B7814CC|nr:uncharacterized protein LOC110672159 [Hevea brasiliensis]